MAKEVNKNSTESIVKRTYLLQQRAQTYIEKQFEMNNFDELKKYNKKQLLELLYGLQYVFLDTDKLTFKNASDGTVIDEIPISYNKFIYYIENLNKLLAFDIIGRYKYLEKQSFAMKADRFKKGSHIYTRTYAGEDINPNIYRI